MPGSAPAGGHGGGARGRANANAQASSRVGEGGEGHFQLPFLRERTASRHFLPGPQALGGTATHLGDTHATPREGPFSTKSAAERWPLNLSSGTLHFPLRAVHGSRGGTSGKGRIWREMLGCTPLETKASSSSKLISAGASRRGELPRAHHHT